MIKLESILIERYGFAPKSIKTGMNRFGKRDALWAYVFEDGGAIHGDWTTGAREYTAPADGHAMTAEQRQEWQRQVELERARRAASQAQQWARNAERNAELQAQLLDIRTGDPVDRYLANRGIASRPLPACLKFHPSLAYWLGDGKVSRHPGMVAPLVAPSGNVVAWHRTYLTDDGRKANVSTPKKLTGTSGLLAGALVPLATPSHGVIGVAEGIETALSVTEASGVPCVAAYSAGNLESFRWPAGVQVIHVYGDNDESGRGQEAAHNLARRASQAGIQAHVHIPETVGADWNDVWRNRAEREAA